MPTPTETGYYWWRDGPSFAWSMQLVATLVWTDGRKVDWRGEFGPRIPDPDRLVALETLAKRNPVVRTGSKLRQWECLFCCGIASSDSDPVSHHPDCPWLRSQELKRDSPAP